MALCGLGFSVPSIILADLLGKCMLRSIRNVKLLKCVSLICLSPLFVFYSSLLEGVRDKGHGL